MTGEPLVVVESIEKSWSDNAQWSPSKLDVVIRRGRFGKPIPIQGVAGKKYEEIRIKTFTETDDDIYDLWKSEYAQLLDIECTQQHRPIPSLTTFVRYRPNHIKQRPHHSQFGCTKCVHFRFLHQALHKRLGHQHVCRTARCPNYRIPMGNKGCTCDGCTYCYIWSLQDVARADLIRELCCKHNGHFPGIRCAVGDCVNSQCIALGNRYEKLLEHGTGCATWTTPGNDVVIKYQMYTEMSNNDIHKNRWALVWAKKNWPEFKDLYLEKLGEYVHHQFNKQRQNDVRYKMGNEINGVSQLPINTVMSSMDFVQNIKLKTTVQTHATQTKLFDVQLLAIYDLCTVNGKLQRRAYLFLSDMPHKGWHSAIPAYRHYLRMRKRDFRGRGITLKHNYFWSDRGTGDCFNAGFIGYSADVVYSEGVELNLNTSGVQHGKHIHDQIGGDGGRLVQKAHKKVKLFEGDSPAKKYTIWLNANCRNPKKKKNKGITRYFIYLPFNVIRYVNPCPIDTLPCKIKKFHCVHIDSSKKVWVRPNSCCCRKCMSGKHSECTEKRWCGTMREAVGGIPNHVPYDMLVSRYDNDGKLRPPPAKRARVSG